MGEHDIRNLNKTGNPKPQEIKSQKGSQKPPPKNVTFRPNSNSVSRTNTKKSTNSNSKNVQAETIPEEAKLSAPDPPKPEEITVTLQARTEEVVPDNESKVRDLDEFEARQKLMEEQNRKRKELLAKALADRTKRSQEEAHRLQEIQEDFRKLDVVLSNDVKILRKQIELASIDYMECQKKFDRIEKEFLEMKVLLHTKQEKKEMLTEHLCAIIEKNEERKAEKLNELLLKLEICDKESKNNPIENGIN